MICRTSYYNNRRSFKQYTLFTYSESDTYLSIYLACTYMCTKGRDTREEALRRRQKESSSIINLMLHLLLMYFSIYGNGKKLGQFIIFLQAEQGAHKD